MDPDEAAGGEAQDTPRPEPAADETGQASPAQGASPPDAPEASNPSATPGPAAGSAAIEGELAPAQPQDVPAEDAPPSAPAPASDGPQEVPDAQAATPEDATRPPDPAAEAPALEGAVPAPTDTSMYLTVPALGLERAPVVDDSSKEAMDQGVIHVPGTGFPWLPSGEDGSNTYLAAHRIGYPGTGSDRVFYELPALALGDEVILTDSNGESYEYRVAEAGEVSPYDTWVANPIPGRDVVTLQTCIEDFGEHWGEGPEWAARYVVRAERAS